MPKLISTVFKIIIVMALSLILWDLAFGSISRSIVWNSIEQVYERYYKLASLDDGNTMHSTLKSAFESAKDESTN